MDPDEIAIGICGLCFRKAPETADRQTGQRRSSGGPRRVLTRQGSQQTACPQGIVFATTGAAKHAMQIELEEVEKDFEFELVLQSSTANEGTGIPSKDVDQESDVVSTLICCSGSEKPGEYCISFPAETRLKLLAVSLSGSPRRVVVASFVAEPQMNSRNWRRTGKERAASKQPVRAHYTFEIGFHSWRAYVLVCTVLEAVFCQIRKVTGQSLIFIESLF